MALQDFGPIGVYLIIAFIITLIVLVISRIFGPHRPTFRKTAPYESGMKPLGPEPSGRRMSVQFYLVAVLFIIFDVEVIFFLPWSTVMRDLGLYGLAVMGVFTIFLLVGFIYEWKKGALEWE